MTNTRESKIFKVTFIGAIVNVLLSIAKLVAGLLGNSAAMLADAIHSVSDLATDLTVVIFVRIASKPRDEDHDFGHGKFETLSSIIVGVALIVIGFGILRYGFFEIVDFIKGNPIREPNMLAFWAAITSIIVKELLFRYTIVKGKSLSSPAVVANAWHHRSDAFSSVGTAIGIGGAILLGESWYILDPIAAVVVSIIVIKAGVEFVLPGINELLEKSLPKEVEDKIIDIIQSNPKVCNPHNLRTRNIGTSYAIEVHIRLPGNMLVEESHELTQSIENQIKEQYGYRTHIIIHVEPIKCDK